jgi:hypothetical protein
LGRNSQFENAASGVQGLLDGFISGATYH